MRAKDQAVRTLAAGGDPSEAQAVFAAALCLTPGAATGGGTAAGGGLATTRTSRDMPNRHRHPVHRPMPPPPHSASPRSEVAGSAVADGMAEEAGGGGEGQPAGLGVHVLSTPLLNSSRKPAQASVLLRQPPQQQATTAQRQQQWWGGQPPPPQYGCVSI